MNKQEIIKQAYGKNWEALKDYISDNGWVRVPKGLDVGLINDISLMEQMPESPNLWRPIVLNGLETNNGWIKIESDDDLPKEDIKCFIIFDDSKEIRTGAFSNDFKYFYVFGEHSNFNCLGKKAKYYKPNPTPKMPIY